MQGQTLREVLETSSGDTYVYVQTLPGQAFDLANLKNGVNYIEVRANPARRPFESSTHNNVSYWRVRLSGWGREGDGAEGRGRG